MQNNIKTSENNQTDNFLDDYEKIVLATKTSVVIQTEWNQNGDYFQKLSIYDNSYSPIKTLGSTTLIKVL